MPGILRPCAGSGTASMRAAEERGPRGLRFKLFTYFFLFSLLILLLLWGFQIFLLPRFYASTTESRLDKAADTIASAVDTPALYETVELASRQNNACISVYRMENLQALCLCSVDAEVGCVLHVLSQRQLNDLYNNARGSSGSYNTAYQLLEGSEFRFAEPGEMPPGERVIDERGVYAHIVESRDKGELFILMDCPLTPIESTINVLRVQLLVLSVSLLLISFLLAYVISRHIAEPLTFLNIAARRLPSGRYPADYRESGYREVAELSETLSEAALEIGKVDKMQKELIANISHDLRTPLTMIIGYAEVMRDMAGENTPENMQVIINEAHRLTSMVEDLVSISRYQGHAESLTPERFSLSNEVMLLAEEYRALLVESGGYTIDEEIEADLFVNADRRAITQTLRNLINNAVNYAGEDKKIILRLHKAEGSAIRFEVEDHGRGIAEADIERIWDRYYRVDREHVRSVVGSGLGLSIVRQNLDAHKARYGVVSREGEGSTFWFELKKE